MDLLNSLNRNEFINNINSYKNSKDKSDLAIFLILDSEPEYFSDFLIKSKLEEIYSRENRDKIIKESYEDELFKKEFNPLYPNSFKVKLRLCQLINQFDDLYGIENEDDFLNDIGINLFENLKSVK